MKLLEKTTYDQYVKMLARGGNAIVHQCLELNISPLECAKSLQEANTTIALLDFYKGQPDHYSFIGLSPFLTYKVKNGSTEIRDKNSITTSSHNPFNLLRQSLNAKPKCTHPDARLTAAPIGILGFDAAKYIEQLPTKHKSKKEIPAIEINFFEYGIYFNYSKKTITVSKMVKVQPPSEEHYQQIMNELLELSQQLYCQTQESSSRASPQQQEFSVDLSDDDFAKKVNQAKEYIEQGEVFQMVLSRTFEKTFSANPLNLYQRLLNSNPSAYHFYMQTADYCLVGASPEKIIRIQNKTVTSTPLAGTKPISKDVGEVISDLLTDKKELAEHMMLVDLSRNDVGRIATPGTVSTTRLTYPLILKNVIHIASDVQGTLDPKFDAIDALQASFPAGTLSGAPKIRAMELIDKLENSNRGFYGGCVFALDHEGDLDTCIIIRNAVISDNKITVRSGCGIVHDSDPAT